MSDIFRALPQWAYPNLSEEEQLLPMVFLTGPRQVGKTWLTRSLPASYFNWDTPEVKRARQKDPYFFRTGSKLIIFDEVHKRRDWKKILKGYFDSPDRRENFLVTGSAKMDQYVRGGDSLQGRYDLFHLWPITWDEFQTPADTQIVLHAPRTWKTWEPDSIGSRGSQTDQDLIALGGFPLPLLKGKETYLRRWQDQYLARLVREDTRDFSAVQHLDKLDLLARILPDRVASPLSIKGLAEDVEVSPVAIKSWMRLLEVLYLGFQMRPFHYKIHRAVKKEAKWYFYQWTFVEDVAKRFENYLAVQLMAACSAWTEQGQGRFEVFYLRDQDRREVDFLISRDMKPLVLIEAKTSDQDFPAALHYYSRKLNLPAYLIFPTAAKSTPPIRKIAQGQWIMSSARFLRGLLGHPARP